MEVFYKGLNDLSGHSKVSVCKSYNFYYIGQRLCFTMRIKMVRAELVRGVKHGVNYN